MSDYFTPLDAEGTQRLKFVKSNVNILHGRLGRRMLGPMAVAEINGQHYIVVGRSCGLKNCDCNAAIVKIRWNQVKAAARLVDETLDRFDI